MKITIKENEIELKNTFRSMIIYEKINGKSFNPKGLTEIILYFYCVVMASDKDLDLEFEEFVEYLDNNPNLLTEFSVWLNKIFSINNFINGDVEKDNENPKKA